MAYRYSETKTDTTHYIDATDPDKVVSLGAYDYSPIASAVVERPRFESNVVAGGAKKEGAVLHIKGGITQKGSLFRQNYQEQREQESEEGDQLKLFEYRPPVVTRLDSDPSMRTAVPTILGHIVNKYPDIVSDSTLSQHSSRIVKKGIEKGVVTGGEVNPTGEAVVEKNREENRISTVGRDTAIPNNSTLLSAVDLSAARSKVRDVLRPKKLSAQFDAVNGPPLNHPQLPGMED